MMDNSLFFFRQFLTRKNVSFLCAQLEILISRSVQIVNKILSPTRAARDSEARCASGAGGASRSTYWQLI